MQNISSETWFLKLWQLCKVYFYHWSKIWNIRPACVGFLFLEIWQNDIKVICSFAQKYAVCKKLAGYLQFWSRGSPSNIISVMEAKFSVIGPISAGRICWEIAWTELSSPIHLTTISSRDFHCLSSNNVFQKPFKALKCMFLFLSRIVLDKLMEESNPNIFEGCQHCQHPLSLFI